MRSPLRRQGEYDNFYKFGSFRKDPNRFSTSSKHSCSSGLSGIRENPLKNNILSMLIRASACGRVLCTVAEMPAGVLLQEIHKRPGEVARRGDYSCCCCCCYYPSNLLLKLEASTATVASIATAPSPAPLPLPALATVTLQATGRSQPGRLT